MWDTPKTRWAGEEYDWTQKVARHLPLKEDVVDALLNMPREPTTRLEKKHGGTLSKKTRDLDPVVLEPPAKPDGIEWAIRVDRKTVVQLMM